MAFRISARTEAGTSVLSLEGRLDGEGAAELRRVLADSPRPLRVELRDLRSADAAGQEALRALKAGGISLDGLSPYLDLLIQAPGDGSPGQPRAEGPHAAATRRRRPSRGDGLPRARYADPDGRARGRRKR